MVESSLNLPRATLLINGLSPSPYTLCTKPLCQHGNGPMGSYWRPPTTQTRRAGSSTFSETVSIQVLVSVTVFLCHYYDVIMGAMASQITSLTIVYSTVDWGADQRRPQSSASLAFVREIHRWPVNSPHKWASNAEMFPFDDVIMMVIASFVMQLLLSSTFEISLKKLSQTSKWRPSYLGLNVLTALKKSITKRMGHQIHIFAYRSMNHTVFFICLLWSINVVPSFTFTILNSALQ